MVRRVADMKERKTRYELGLNWKGRDSHPFLRELARAAKRRKIGFLCVRKEDAGRVRRRVDRGKLRIGLFLNTQADGVNMESEEMLLCCALKGSGSWVVEDPDDARVYADRALLLERLHLAGVPVPPFVAVNPSGNEGTRLPHAQRLRLMPQWHARSACGMGNVRTLTSSASYVLSALRRNGFPPEKKVLVCRRQRPARSGGRDIHFFLWHLFDRIVPCWASESTGALGMVSAEEWSQRDLAPLAALADTVAEITGLDWFVTEVICPRGHRALRPMVVEPAGALAGLGPGMSPPRRMPADVCRAAAEALADAAWRLSLGEAPVRGKSLILADSR